MRNGLEVGHDNRNAKQYRYAAMKNSIVLTLLRRYGRPIVCCDCRGADDLVREESQQASPMQHCGSRDDPKSRQREMESTHADLAYMVIRLYP